jgi:hypothetical protein
MQGGVRGGGGVEGGLVFPVIIGINEAYPMGCSHADIESQRKGKIIY